MKKILVYLFILVAGIGIGYLSNYEPNKKETPEQKPEKIIIEKIKKQIVRDTVEVEKIVTVIAEVDSSTTSTDIIMTDSLTLADDRNDIIEENEQEEVIIMEELIAQRTIALSAAPSDTSDVSEILKLKTAAFAKEIVVEFWQSPLNITGYELTRNRLKLFGFNPSESISLQLDKIENQILLNTETMSIVLQKSKQFKTLKLR
ncbi:hypothetical protein [Brumimicrobium oceani]|uniref:Uncharacterized protein n=1 Tax=Brumimicrobium oceani TaxID=2100725 RepID=A0A2U2XHC8_9FLAO|nr:hypothetical protein [Brumimicrobium oceani]PWH87194.1 hypothetical protein DIT68_02725 [Brumimicrobium oceani]